MTYAHLRQAGRERRVPLDGCPQITGDVFTALAGNGYLTADQERRYADAIEAAGHVIRQREFESKRERVKCEEDDDE